MMMIMAAAPASGAFDNGSRGTATASVLGLSWSGHPNHHGSPRRPQRGSRHTQHIYPLSCLRFPLCMYIGGRAPAQGEDTHRITQNLSYPVLSSSSFLFIYFFHYLVWKINKNLCFRQNALTSIVKYFKNRNNFQQRFSLNPILILSHKNNFHPKKRRRKYCVLKILFPNTFLMNSTIFLKKI